jgi:hypothetical protein
MSRIEITSAKAADYYWFAEKCLKLQDYGSKAITDDKIIVICKYTPIKAILICVGEGWLVTPHFKYDPIPYDKQQSVEYNINTNELNKSQDQKCGRGNFDSSNSGIWSTLHSRQSR